MHPERSNENRLSPLRRPLAGLAAIGLGAALAVVEVGVDQHPAAAAVNPSGVAAPATGDANWQLTATDEFTSPTLNPMWSVNHGATGRKNWQAGQVLLGNGMLTLRVSKDAQGHWAAGSVNNGVHQTYGKYLVRARLGPGAGTRGVLLLWPTAASWPPEVDFFEIGGSDPARQTATQTLHYSSANRQVHTSYPCSCSGWHTYGVEWSPSKLVYTMDGAVMRTVVSSAVPAQPMHLGINSSPGGEAPPGLATPPQVDFQVDWVAIYKPRPNASPAAVTTGSGIEYFKQGDHGDLEHRTWMTGSGWSPASSLGGAMVGGPAVASAVPGVASVFVRGTNSLLYTRTLNTGWTTFGGVALSPPAAVRIAPGRTALTVVGGDGQLWYRETSATGAWAGWLPIGGRAATGTGPAMSSPGNGTLNVFVHGTDGTLWLRSRTPTGWTGWASLGGGLLSDPGAVWDSGRLSVFVRGTDNRLWSRTYAGGWSSWQALGGSIASGPAVTAASGRTDVFAAGTDGQDYQITASPGWSGWRTLP